MVGKLRIKYCVLFVIFILLSLIIFVLFKSKGYKYIDITDQNCVIQNLDDLNTCIKTGSFFVNIKTDSIIDLDYSFSNSKKNKTVSKLLDIGIRINDNEDDGYVSLIGLTSIADANKLLEELKTNKTVIFKTHLLKFENNLYLEAFNDIKQKHVNYYISEEYSDKYNIEFTEDQAKGFILDINFDSYTINNSFYFMYIYTFLWLLFIIISLFISIKCLYQLLFIYKTKKFNGLSKSEIDDILAKNIERIKFENKYLLLSEDYFYIKKFNNFALGYIKDIVWVYVKQEKNKKNKTRFYIVLNLKNKKTYKIYTKKADLSGIIKLIKELNSSISTDFSVKNLKCFKKNGSVVI